MELTQHQYRAARACGFAFFPANEAQVQRLTMQKRIFRLEGHALLATRDGAYWETHGTLMRVMEEQVRSGVLMEIAVSDGTPPPQSTSTDSALPTAEVPAHATVQQDSVSIAAVDAPKGSGTRTTRKRAARAPQTEQQQNGRAAGSGAAPLETDIKILEPPNAAEEPEPAAETPAGDSAMPARRQPRTRGPKVPRWVTAGRERRGRLK